MIANLLAQRLRQLFRDAIPAGFYSNAAWQYVTSFAGAGLNFLWLLVAGAALGAAEFGRLSIALGFVTVVFQLVELRLHEAVIRYACELRERGETLRLIAAMKLFLLADAVTGAAAFILVFLAAPLAAKFLLKDEYGAHLILIAAVAVLFQNVTTATSIGLHRAFSEFRGQAIVTAFGGVLKVAATVVAIRSHGADAAGVLLVAAAVHFLTNAVLTANAMRVLFASAGPRGPAPISLVADRLPEIRRFVGSTYLLSLSMIPTKELDINVLGYFGTPAEVGAYKLAKTCVTAVAMLVDPAFFVVYPQLATMWIRREAAKIRAFVRSLTIVFGAASLALSVLASIAVPWVLTRFGGGQYAASGSIFLWMIWGFPLWAPLIWVNPLLTAADRPGIVTRASLAGSAVILGLFLVLVPRWGAHGAAVAHVVTPPIIMALALYRGHRAGIVPPAF